MFMQSCATFVKEQKDREARSTYCKKREFCGYPKTEKKRENFRYQKKRKIKKTVILAIIGPRDPENRVRDAFLRRLVDGELRRMIFKRFYANLRKKVVRKVFRFTTKQDFCRHSARPIGHSGKLRWKGWTRPPTSTDNPGTHKYT